MRLLQEFDLSGPARQSRAGGVFAVILGLLSIAGQVHAETLYFPLFGNGHGITSVVVLVNPSGTETVTGNIAFLDQKGEPWNVGVAAWPGQELVAQDLSFLRSFAGQLKTSVDFSIAPLDSAVVATDGLGTAASGSAVVSADKRIGGVVRFALVGIGTAGVGAASPSERIIAPVRRAVGGINTGVAIQNISAAAMRASLALRRRGGGEVGSASVDLAPGGQISRFINELFPGVNTDAFEGTVIVRADNGKLAAVALELGLQPGQFTTLPVAPLNEEIRGFAVTNPAAVTVGGHAYLSSGKLKAEWVPPGGSVDHYELSAVQTGANTTSTGRADRAASSMTLAGLKAGTAYTVTLRACADAPCSVLAAPEVSGTGMTAQEAWQLQGSGNTVAGLTRIVSDGNARISATRFGPDASGGNASRIQLYYGPSATPSQTLAVAVTSQATDAAVPGSYLNFTSMATTTGLRSPPTGTPLVARMATGQGVPLSASLGGKVRLFFEANGSDGKTRILYLDSQDGYTGRDFNSGSSGICSTTADYQTAGCVPTVAIGVAGDATNGNSRIPNARQFKLGYPVLNDWRWNGETGTFMVFTTDVIAGCSASNRNHGYAVLNGNRWQVQYDSAGCPKLFTSVQAMFPMHIGEARYKMYYGDTSITTGRGASNLPFLGPKQLIYADARTTGSSSTVDFEDWEPTAASRNVVFLWPNGDPLNDSAEGYIDDFHFLSPTGSLDLQVMYMAITDGFIPPIGAAAILLNP